MVKRMKTTRDTTRPALDSPPPPPPLLALLPPFFAMSPTSETPLIAAVSNSADRGIAWPHAAHRSCLKCTFSVKQGEMLSIGLAAQRVSAERAARVVHGMPVKGEISGQPNDGM